MAIDRFETERFEAALPHDAQEGVPLWRYGGMQSGERVYYVGAGPYARVVVRSTIDESGIAADTGEDSIRLWLEVQNGNGGFKAIKKLDTYTTRVNGWEKRMLDKMRELYRHGIKVKKPIDTCSSCGEGKAVWFTASGPNRGRPACKCFDCNSGFVWLDQGEEVEPDEWLPRIRLAESGIANEEREGPVAPAPVAEPVQEEEEGDSIFDQLREIAEEAFERIGPKREPSPQQKLAIYASTDVPIRVLASAGSGKTFVLENRYAYLLERGFEPEDIVVVTFTKDMSKDMANRIMTLNPVIAGTAGEQQICSIHAFCNRVLRAEGERRRIPDKSWEVKRLLQDIAKELWPILDETDDSRCRPSWEELLNVIGNAKYRGFRMDEGFDWYMERFGGYHAQRLVTARTRFDLAMQGKNWWTFADMLYEMEQRLINDPEFLSRCQNRFKYIMVDEGQDTNGQAMRILTTIAEPDNRLFIVGDPDQLLFRFTGATPEENLYDGFSERYAGGKTYFLETNYRSTHTIVNQSNNLIAHNYERLNGPYDEAFRKSCTASETAEQGEEIVWSWHESAEDEAEGVTNSILELIHNGRRPGEIFVATRTRAQLGYLEGPLTKAGVPFVNITGGSFWQLRHVQLVLSYLRLTLEPADEDSFRRIYNVASNNMLDRNGEYCATRWLGNSFLNRVNRVYNRREIIEAGSSYYGWQSGINDLVDFMDELKEEMEEGNTAKAIRWIIDNSINRYLRQEEGVSDDEGIGKLADLETVVDVASKFETPELFLERVDEAIKAAQDAKTKNWDEYVVLSTVHRLKGMERPFVFGIGWVEGERVSKEGSGMPAGLLPHTFSLTQPPSNGPLSMNGQGRVEDERCIAYVLITRAQERVFLSGYQYGTFAVFQPSRFVQELGLA